VKIRRQPWLVECVSDVAEDGADQWTKPDQNDDDDDCDESKQEPVLDESLAALAAARKGKEPMKEIDSGLGHGSGLTSFP
jgi:hypothetical protein